MIQPTIPQIVMPWLQLIITVAGLGFAGWRAYNALVNKVNGLGERVNKNDTEIATLRESKENQMRRLDIASSTGEGVRDRVSTAEGKIEAIKEEIRDDRLAIMSTLHQAEKTAADRSAKIESTLARLEEKINIKEIVREVTRSQRGD